MSEAFRVDVRSVDGGATALGWGGSVTVVIARPTEAGGRGLGFNGGQLLNIAVAGCVSNDLFREAAKRGILTGRKEEQKIYRRHSGYEGGLREERAKDVRVRRPIRIVEEAVRGMLPKTTLGDAMYRKLKVYAGPDHPHAAKKPTKLEVA